MNRDQRVIFSDNGTLYDRSVELGDYRSKTALFNYTTAQDYLFVGSYFPFNHKQFDISVANAVSSAVTVAIWDGSSFNNAVDVMDETVIAGASASLAQDGIIRWSTNKSKTWARQSESTDVTGLSGTVIYDMYWVRFSWSATMTGTTALKYVGQKFSTDTILYTYYPDLNNSDLQGAFASGKTDWNDQHYMASEQIVRDSRKKNILKSSGQIIDESIFEEVSTHKVAEIIYHGLGTSYADLKKDAAIKYKESLDQGFLNIDYDNDANLSDDERYTKQGFLSR